MSKRLATHIGTSRANQFLESLPPNVLDSQISLYIFDLNLRALVIKSMSIIEIALELEIQIDATHSSRENFGSLRRLLKTLNSNRQFTLSRKLGFANQREMHVSLRNLNALRNRAAHHEPIWRRKLHFGVPKFRESTLVLLGYTAIDWYSPAASILVIAALLRRLPELINFESEFEALLIRTEVDRIFLLRNMGFEVP